MEGGYIWHAVVGEKGITTVRFGNLNNKVLVTSRGNAILSFTVGDKRRPVSYKAPKFTNTVGIFNGDGSEVIGGSIEGKIGIWPAHGLSAKKITVAHSSAINDIAYSAITNQIVTASNDQLIKIFTKDLQFIKTVKLHKTQVTAIAASTTDSYIVSGDAFGHIILWDLKNPNDEPIWNKSLRVAKRTSIVSLSFDCTGSFLAAATSDGHVSVWSVPNGELIQAYEDNTSCISFSPTKPLLLVSCSDGMQKVYSLQSSSLLFSFEGHKAPGIASAWDPTGVRFVSADRDGTVIGWDIPKFEYQPVWVSRKEEERKKKQEVIAKQQQEAPKQSPEATIKVLQKLLPQLERMSDSMNELAERCSNQEERLNKLIEASK